MPLTRRSLILLASLAALPAALPAQSTPEAAATAMADAVRRSDWAAAARMMHPGAIRQLRGIFQPFLAQPGMEDLGPQLFSTPNAELAATPDTVLFARFLKNVMAQLPGMEQALKTAQFTPLGHVPGGADTVLVVNRMVLTMDGTTISQFDVMPFRQENGRWWALLKSDFTNMAAMLHRATQQPPAAN